VPMAKAPGIMSLSSLSINNNDLSRFPTPKSPSYQERNPFPGLSVTTPPADVSRKLEPASNGTPSTAWPSAGIGKQSPTLDTAGPPLRIFPKNLRTLHKLQDRRRSQKSSNQRLRHLQTLLRRTQAGIGALMTGHLRQRLPRINSKPTLPSLTARGTGILWSRSQRLSFIKIRTNCLRSTYLPHQYSCLYFLSFWARQTHSSSNQRPIRVNLSKNGFWQIQKRSNSCEVTWHWLGSPHASLQGASHVGIGTNSLLSPCPFPRPAAKA